MTTVDYPLGTIVEVPLGKGVIRFSGPTSFRPGKWVGIELYEPNGKNDGSVDGVPYFSCKPNCGVFIRAAQIKATFGNERDSMAAPKAGGTRPAIGHQRTSSKTTLLRPASGSPRSISPVKASTNTGATQGSKPVSTPTAVKRMSLQRTAPTKKASSPVGSSAALTSPNGAVPRVSSPLALPPSSPISDVSPSRPHSATSPASPPVASASALSSPVAPPLAAPPTANAEELAVLEKEITELRSKIRFMESKRHNDTITIRELSQKLADSEQFIAIKPKLQAKLQSLQTDLTTTKRELADTFGLKEMAERRAVDVEELLEIALLDKEVAEEKAEAAEIELEEVKENLAIAQVELEVLKEEQLAIEEAANEAEEAEEEESLVDPTLSPSRQPQKLSSKQAKANALAMIQLEKQNERLKEALLRLRDMTQETDMDQRRRIADMEKDISNFDDVAAKYETTTIQLSNAEIQIEDLKLQLDDALGAEEMLVQLTERNLMLGEKIEEMRITIEDLEALKELNDELEESHIETERALQEEIDSKDAEIREHKESIDILQDTCIDLEGTIGQFRELVLKLQEEIASLHQTTASAESAQQSASAQAAAVLSMNMKLQSSAAKQRAKELDYELCKGQEKEGTERLAIITPYLPDTYRSSGDADALAAYFCFQRIAWKADTINKVVADIHGLPKALEGGTGKDGKDASVNEVLVGVCEMRSRLSTLSTLCKRFTAILRLCDPDSFLSVGRLASDLIPLEKRLDLHIDLLRRDTFMERECVDDVSKVQAQLDHVEETFFNFAGFDEFDLGERELGYLVGFELDLDMFAAAVGLVRGSVQSVVSDQEAVLDMGGFDIEMELFQPLTKLLNLSKSAKTMSRRLTKRIEELLVDSQALKATLVPQMKFLSLGMQAPFNFAVSLAQEIMSHISDVRSEKSSFQLAKVMSLVQQTASSTVGPGDGSQNSSPWDSIKTFIEHLIEEGTKLQPLMSENENVVKVAGTSPWSTRVAEIKASATINHEAERKVSQMSEDIQDLLRTLRTKDQVIQESSVKIELLDRRMEASKKQADALAELENELAKAKRQERTYEEALEQLQQDLDTAEKENAKLKTVASGAEKQAQAPTSQIQNGPQGDMLDNIAIEGSLETSYLLEQIEALRGTVRFLRTENYYLKGQDLIREIEALPPLPEPVSRMATPPLDPSGLSDSDEDSEIGETSVFSRPTLRSLSTETKMLYRDVIRFSSSPRVVDLSELQAKREAKGANGKVWMPRKKTPVHQVLERKLEAERLSRRLKGLLDRTGAIEAS